MNVIFLDFDGVINTLNSVLRPKEKENAKEERIKILSEICHRYDCKVVIISSHKDQIDEETLETDLDWIKEYFRLFKKYDIEVIGRTPLVEKNFEENYYRIIKEDEIEEYLKKHKEVERFCIIDDDDLISEPSKKKGDFRNSDLNRYREYLISPLLYSDIDPTKAGLQREHIEEVGKILQKKRI